MESAKINLTVVSDGKSLGVKPPVDESTLAHKHMVRGPFWQKIPAYASASRCHSELEIKMCVTPN